MDNDLVTSLFRRHLLGKRYASVSQWCRVSVYLPAESGSAQGWYVPTPYQEGHVLDLRRLMMDRKSSTLQKSARICYSLAVTVYGLWSMAERRRPCRLLPTHGPQRRILCVFDRSESSSHSRLPLPVLSAMVGRFAKVRRTPNVPQQADQDTF